MKKQFPAFLALLGIIAGFWLVKMTVGFFLVWGPPAILAVFLLSLPWVNRRIAGIYYKKNGFGPWSATPSTIKQALQDSHFVGAISVGTTAALLLWIEFVGYPALSLGKTFGSETLEGFFVNDTGGAQFARFIFTFGPWPLAVWGVVRSGRFYVIRSVQDIAEKLAGSDLRTETLQRLDREIEQCYLTLGSDFTSSSASDFQVWIGGNIHEAILNSKQYKNAYIALERVTGHKLSELKQCVEKFTEAKASYQKGLTLLRKNRSVALLGVLEDAGRTLVADEFVKLVNESRWEDVRAFLSMAMEELKQIEAMGDAWSSKDEEAAPAPEAPQSSEEMTFERAIRILALPKTFRPEDLKRRRKELANIYHPDRAAFDADLVARNQETMTEINEACDFLSKLQPAK